MQSALRLLVHRIQSSNEQEAINALLTLDICAERCGHGFQDEIGKFRFLNELIKLVSPKYLGSRTAPVVKKKVIEILYGWTRTLKDQPKIKDAYDMLKWQKVVIEDPMIELPPLPRRQNSIFEDEEKAKLLQKLLHSQNREDIQAANRLIKTMVKEDEKRKENQARRMTELETVCNNVKVLSDMLITYETGSTSLDDIELMKELYQTCEGIRPNLFRLASDTDDRDDHLGDILKANDELVRVIEQFQRLFGTDMSLASRADQRQRLEGEQEQKSNVSLLDLGSPLAETQKAKPEVVENLLDDQWLASDEVLLGALEQLQGKNDLDELEDIFASVTPTAKSVPLPDVFGMNSAGALLTPSKSNAASVSLIVEGAQVPFSENKKAVKGLEDLDALGLNLLKQALPPNASLGKEFHKPAEKLPMNQMLKQSSLPDLSPKHNAVSSLLTDGGPTQELSLTDLFIPLEAIQPGSIPPLTLYDKNELNVVVHHGKENPKPDVYVMVMTAINKSPHMVSTFYFQAAVPKSMRVKLQPPSATQMPAFNPILPPAAITQVMLLVRSSSKERVKLKYKISYTVNGQNQIDVGEVENLLST